MTRAGAADARQAPALVDYVHRLGTALVRDLVTDSDNRDGRLTMDEGMGTECRTCGKPASEVQDHMVDGELFHADCIPAEDDDDAPASTELDEDDIPADFPVRPLRDGDKATDRVTDGQCGLSWDDAIGTAYTPAPSARCPFEAFHQ